MKDKVLGRGLGHGHSTSTPNLPLIRAVEMPPDLVDQLEPGTKRFKMGKVNILLSPPFNGAGWHMSLSCPDRLPTWDEVAKAWYDLVPLAEKKTGALVLPPKREYIDIHKFCLHVHELVAGRLPA